MCKCHITNKYGFIRHFLFPYTSTVIDAEIKNTHCIYNCKKTNNITRNPTLNISYAQLIKICRFKFFRSLVYLFIIVFKHQFYPFQLSRTLAAALFIKIANSVYKDLHCYSQGCTLSLI